MASHDAYPQLSALRGVPTLVVSGQLDRIAKPEYGRRLAAAIPGARFELLEGLAHGAPLEEPARLNQMLADFVQSGK